MMLQHAILATLLTLPGFASLCAQISFTDRSDLLQNQNMTSGIAIAVVDMNADGLDDIVRLDSAHLLCIEYQTPGGQPFTHFTVGPVPGRAWAIAVADVNNDGHCDIFTGGRYDGVKVLLAYPADSSYQLTFLPGENIFVQGANLADIDNDGFLDAFACHDDGLSRIWGNNGDGSFFEANAWINMETSPPSDNSGNYGSIWTDFDNDGDLDLYIAKCRINVNNPDDPRRINALFVNDGNALFTEAAARFGLKIAWQSWTSDFQDIDNDGDLDCLVTNHDYPLQLLENDGAGFFTDISEKTGVASFSGDFLQAILRDFDNDGFVDIITAEPAFLLRNNGNKTFSPLPHPFQNSLGTLACGDLNHDGFPDIFGANPCNINSFPCTQAVPDRLWLNDANADHHFIAFSLQGAQSNFNGVGARIEIHGEWGIQIREVRSGESYGIMNSLTQHFGLGKATTVEYAVVRWPSGAVDVLKNPAIDHFHTIVEGSTCTLPAFEVVLDGDTVLCAGEPPITLSAPAGFVYLWCNGARSQSIEAGTAGNYSLLLVDSLGCAARSNLVRIVANLDEKPAITAAGETTFCQGSAVVLTASNGTSYTWPDGSAGNSLTATATGDYFVVNHGACGDVASEILHVQVLPAPPPFVADTTITSPQSVTLVAQGNNPRWYETAISQSPFSIGDTLLTPVITQTTTYFVEDLFTYGGDSFATGMAAHEGTLFNGNSVNGQLLFDVEKAFTLEQVTVYTDTPGKRVLELRNAGGEVLQSDTVDLAVGETLLHPGFLLQPGTGYRLTTNTAMNQAVLGTSSPRLRRSDLNVKYPYLTPGVLSITGSNFGSGFYYYFFNWQITLQPTLCTSERLPVTITLEPTATQETLPAGSLRIFPNPSSGLFTLETEPWTGGTATLAVHDVTGKQLFSRQILEEDTGLRQAIPIDLRHLPAGVYFVTIRCGEKTGKAKVVRL